MFSQSLLRIRNQREDVEAHALSRPSVDKSRDELAVLGEKLRRLTNIMETEYTGIVNFKKEACGFLISFACSIFLIVYLCNFFSLCYLVLNLLFFFFSYPRLPQNCITRRKPCAQWSAWRRARLPGSRTPRCRLHTSSAFWSSLRNGKLSCEWRKPFKCATVRVLCVRAIIRIKQATS